jgi:hypothetical protein
VQPKGRDELSLPLLKGITVDEPESGTFMVYLGNSIVR